MSGLKTKIEETLATFWDEHVIPLHGAGEPAGEAGADLDSLSSIEVLIEIDRIVGFEVQAEAVIRRGGYASREQFITELSSAVIKEVKEHSP